MQTITYGIYGCEKDCNDCDLFPCKLVKVISVKNERQDLDLNSFFEGKFEEKEWIPNFGKD